MGVTEDGKFPQVLDPDAMFVWNNARSGIQMVSADVSAVCNTRPQAPPKLLPPGVEREPDFGVSDLEGEKLDVLRLTGWGVLFGPNTPQTIKDNLKPLLKHREKEVDDKTPDKHLFQIFDGDHGGYKPEYKTADDWLKQFGAESGAQVVRKKGVPYYLMIVASPQDIPFEFQYQLDVYWAVGRLWLENDEDYAAYAKAVVEYEQGLRETAAQRLTFFATRFAKDNGATALFCDSLVTPLLGDGIAQERGFETEFITGPEATRDRLLKLYGAKQDRPAIYFCGSHGLKRGGASPALPDTMGALMCENWTGDQPPVPAQWVAGGDLPADADLSGTMHFLFACYSAGWPERSDYDSSDRLAPAAMVARLPQKILAKGALATFGHIDSVWSYSYQAGDGMDRTGEFTSILTRLMDGARAGHATDSFNVRWNVLGGMIAQKAATGTFESTEEEHNMWIQHDDARNHVLYGDPAVRLRVKPVT